MGWTAVGRLSSDNVDEREGFALLCDVDPVFTLRFDDESTIAVTVHPASDGDGFTLTECTGPEGRSVSRQIAARASSKTARPE